jgi:hypothetical protein
MRLSRALCTGLIVALTVAVFTTAHAQPTLPRRFGITAGFNSATFGGNDVSSPPPDRLKGFVGGAFVVVPVARRLSFQPEVLFTMKGAEYNDSTSRGRFKLNYIEIPLLARFDGETPEGLRPFFVAGPGLAFQTSCNIDVTAFGSTSSSSCADVAAQAGAGLEFQSVDFGMIVGGGLAIDARGTTLTVGARYTYGFGHIEKSSPLTNRVLAILTTIEFPFARK